MDFLEISFLPRIRENSHDAMYNNMNVHYFYWVNFVINDPNSNSPFEFEKKNKIND